MAEQAKTDTALLIIDMINELEFEHARAMTPSVEAAADVILGLRDAADIAGVPVVYVNDNYGKWHLDRTGILDHVRGKSGAPIAERMMPRDTDYFVIKPHVSGFYATNLQALLPRIGVSRLILSGIAADICVLFTAADAHMREYKMWVPADAVASSEKEHRKWSLEIMEKSMAADTRPTHELSLDEWLRNRG